MSVAIDEVKALISRTHDTRNNPPSTARQRPRTKSRVHVQQRRRSERTAAAAMCVY